MRLTHEACLANVLAGDPRRAIGRPIKDVGGADADAEVAVRAALGVDQFDHATTYYTNSTNLMGIEHPSTCRAGTLAPGPGRDPDAGGHRRAMNGHRGISSRPRAPTSVSANSAIWLPMPRTLTVGVNLGVGEGESRPLEAILREADELAVHPRLVAVQLWVVDQLDAHTPSMTSVSSAAQRQCAPARSRSRCSRPSSLAERRNLMISSSSSLANCPFSARCQSAATGPQIWLAAR